MFEGREFIDQPSYRIARAGIAYCPEERGIFAALSVEENLTLPPIVREGGMSVGEIYDLFPNLSERRKRPGTKFAGWEQHMLFFVRTVRTGARLGMMVELARGLVPCMG